MSRFRKFEPRLYSLMRGKLSNPQPCGKYLLTWLLTGPASSILPGVTHGVGAAGLAEMLDWPSDGFRDAIGELKAHGFVKVDLEARLIFVPLAVEINPPQSINVVKSWQNSWGEIPDCLLKYKVWQALRDLVQGKAHAFLDEFNKACPMPRVIQEKEKEQEQEQDARKEEGPCAQSALIPSVASGDLSRFAQLWNDNRGELPFCREVTRGRADKLRSRLKSNPAFESDFAEAVKKAAHTPFLSGQNDRGWKASFDWLVENDTNLHAVLEGKYSGTPGTKMSRKGNGLHTGGDDSGYREGADYVFDNGI